MDVIFHDDAPYFLASWTISSSIDDGVDAIDEMRIWIESFSDCEAKEKEDISNVVITTMVLNIKIS